MATRRNGTPRSADSVLGIPSLELVSGVLHRLPGAHSLAVSICFETGNYQHGASLRVEPEDFTRSSDYALALLSVSLFRKYPGLPGSAEKAENAIAKWRECEEQCRETNARLKQFRIGQVRTDLHEPYRLARKKILNLLGPFRWSKVAPFFDFGPGSSTRLSYSKRHLPYKYGEHPETTLDNLVSAEAVIGLSPVWTRSSGGDYTDRPHPGLKIREESKVTTVPKDAFVDRVIAIEPDMNMFIQKGFGGFLRRRLKRVKIDLDDQSLNQSLACTASRGGLATIDLSSASDTVSWELVKELLPPDWYEALLSCRTHNSRLPSGDIVELQKFSAMGNGFTFELESLIFWALCSSVATRTIGREGLRAAVYGDDIIVTVDDFDAVVDILEFSGFTLNPKKTYASGPYRESCGKHYFYGRDVTPITVTKEITHVSQLLLLCNNLVRWASRSGNSLYRDETVREAYEYAVGHLPKHLQRPRISDGYGDGALVGPFDACRPTRCRNGWDGWRVTGVLLRKQKYRKSSGVPTLAACLSRLESASSPQGSSHLRHHFTGSGPGHSYVLGSDRVETVGRGGFLRVSTRPVRLSGSPGFYPDPRNLHGLRADARSGESVAGKDSSPALVPGSLETRLGKVFIKQWVDIGPWA